jgi:hypothetical protein
LIGAVIGVESADTAMSQSSNAAAESITVQGVLTEGGIVCPLLKLNTGELIPLMGVRTNEYPIGTRLELQGVFVKRSPCQQGKQTLRVQRVVAVDGIVKE